MKKIGGILILLLLNNMLYSQHKVTFIVNQPNATYHDSIYISGTFNNWMDKPDPKYLLTPGSSKTNTITLELKPGIHEYRFHRGNFKKEAATAQGFPARYKKIDIQKDTVITLLIEAWKDHLPFSSILYITDSILTENRGISLGELNTWYFKKGNELPESNKNSDTSGWIRLRPSDIDKSLADKNGRREGWFKTFIKVDSSMMNNPLPFKFDQYGAGELYIDGKLIQAYGVTGTDKKTYKEFSPSHHVPIVFTLDTSGLHVLAIHMVDYLLPLVNEKHNQGWSFSIWDKGAMADYAKHVEEEPFFNTIWLSAGTLLCLLFWALAFQNRDERNLRLIALTSTSLLALSICIWMPHNVFASGFVQAFIGDYIAPVSDKLFYISSILLVVNLFKRRVTLLLKIILGAILLSSLFNFLSDSYGMVSGVCMLLAFLINCYYIISSWKSLKGAQWFIVTGVVLTYVLVLIFLSIGLISPGIINNTVAGLFFTSIFLSLPISLLFYISLRFKEFIKEVQFNAQQVIQLSEEKKQQALEQQKLLELEVARQTLELRTSLETLKKTQSQLIQSEKMASLGELTAGIAHEIQNPLNFVNNFSEVNGELIEELLSERSKVKTERDEALEAELLNNIVENEKKINHHGKRADAIVKGMLQHSRTNSGKKEPTDINALCDEYLRLSYHGLRAKDKSFNATLKTNFDESIGSINIVPQDIGRVVLNLITNAFHAVTARKQQDPDGYEPIVTVSTLKRDDKVVISIADNGSGIPQKILDKIFQPFFTTKPTGQGTGLGLSMSYDIVKAHAGEINVETKEGEGTMFTIVLPG